MEITVTGRHVDITTPIREYAQAKSGKLTKYFDRISMIEVVAEKRDGRLFDVELIAHVDRHEHFVAHGTGEDLYACIDEASDKMERQLTDHKEKLRNRKHQATR